MGMGEGLNLPLSVHRQESSHCTIRQTGTKTTVLNMTYKHKCYCDKGNFSSAKNGSFPFS